MLTREVFGHIDQDSLTYEQKRKALLVLLFLILKRDGSTIKGRACADGRPQRIWTEKLDASSPSIVIEALFYTLIVNEMEGIDVALVTWQENSYKQTWKNSCCSELMEPSHYYLSSWIGRDGRNISGTKDRTLSSM